jgi:hypothetical protein
MERAISGALLLAWFSSFMIMIMLTEIRYPDDGKTGKQKQALPPLLNVARVDLAVGGLTIMWIWYFEFYLPDRSPGTIEQIFWVAVGLTWAISVFVLSAVGTPKYSDRKSKT